MATGHAHTGRTGPLAGPTATTCRIESAGNVVKIRVTPRKEARPGQFRTAVRIYRGDDEEEGMVPTSDSDPYTGVGDSGQASPADSGTCSDLDAGSPPPGHRDDEETSSDSLNGSETDGYEFHLNELGGEPADSGAVVAGGETFAGRVYPCCRPIHSANGTVRGVKNRVRAGIATFLEINNTKSWKEKEAGKVVVYTTTMGIVRSTSERCLKVRRILTTNLIKFTEKDAFMSPEVQAEIAERMAQKPVQLPQVFAGGQYVGDADTIEKLNETGELRTLLKPYKSTEGWTRCEVCGGYRLLPCPLCNGSKKSVHRNHFTTQLVALKCMNCDQVGLVKCYNC